MFFNHSSRHSPAEVGFDDQLSGTWKKFIEDRDRNERCVPEALHETVISPRDSVQQSVPKIAACKRSMSIYMSAETSTDLSDPPRQLQKQPAATTHQLLPGGVV
jgi:hypothetical protein